MKSILSHVELEVEWNVETPKAADLTAVVQQALLFTASNMGEVLGTYCPTLPVLLRLEHRRLQLQIHQQSVVLESTLVTFQRTMLCTAYRLPSQVQPQTSDISAKKNKKTQQQQQQQQQEA